MAGVQLAPTPPGVDEGAWASACAAVRAYCRWHVAPAVTEALTLDGPGGDLMFLPTLRLTDLTSITNDGDVVSSPEWSTSGMVRGAGCWTSKFRGVVAEVTHGYDECPAEVLTVVAEMVASAGRSGVSSVTNHDHQVQFDASMLDRRQRSLLDPYRLVWVS